MRVISDEKIPIKLWLDKIEPDALKQARNLANLENAFHHIAIMPDAHVGYGMPIGGVLATIGTVVPNAVGVDIGCGMAAVKTTVKTINEYTLKQITNKLRKIIPTGFTHHKQAQNWEGFDRAPDIPIIQQELASACKQIGTLGSGNHFIEILQEVSQEKNIWLMLHSGSRNFGYKVANVYHRKAKRFCEENNIKLPDHELAFLSLDTDLGQEYWQAMNYCLDFARANRHLMMGRLMKVWQEVMGGEFINYNEEHNPQDLPLPPSLARRGSGEIYVSIHHNYASQEKHFGKDVIMHRKGATQALAGQLGIVPGSMGTPSYIVEGLGNPESFMSCAHGAGRRMSRREANRKISKQAADKEIQGIVFTGWQGKYDEAPQVYKNINEVIRAQRDLAKPLVKLKPLAVVIGN